MSGGHWQKAEWGKGRDRTLRIKADSRRWAGRGDLDACCGFMASQLLDETGNNCVNGPGLHLGGMTRRGGSQVSLGEQRAEGRRMELALPGRWLRSGADVWAEPTPSL